LRVQATNSRSGFEVTTDGSGVVGHAGAALLRELADRVGLTRALGWRQAGGRRRHPDAAVLRDLAVMLADGGDCLSDLAALRDQPELFGPVASTPTAWRVVDRIGRDADGTRPKECRTASFRTTSALSIGRRERDPGATTSPRWWGRRRTSGSALACRRPSQRPPGAAPGRPARQPPPSR
jgi:hypothetical protein